MLRLESDTHCTLIPPAKLRAFVLMRNRDHDEHTCTAFAFYLHGDKTLCAHAPMNLRAAFEQLRHQLMMHATVDVHEIWLNLDAPPIILDRQRKIVRFDGWSICRDPDSEKWTAVEPGPGA